jgi:hypothetical protein
MLYILVAAALVAAISLLLLGGWIVPVSGLEADAVAALFAISGSAVFLSLESLDG